jgi:hypothetical protein
VRAVCLLVALVLGSQVRDPGSPVEASGGRIAGRVIAADTNRPVSRAAVRLVRANERADFQSTTTNDEGQFVLEAVPAGTYSVYASKPGTFVETAFGQSSHDVPARLITIIAGQTVQVEVALLRGAIVSGRVFDQTGEPLALAGVGLAATDGSASPQRSPYDPGLGTMTNDRGEYRLFGVRPGEYVLTAHAPRLRADPRQYAPIYYPGVTDVAAAGRIQLSAGQEVSGVDLTLRLVSTVTVSGLAIGPDGQPMPGGSIAVYLAGPDGRMLPRSLQTRATSGYDGLTGVGSIKADGTFRIDVIPNHYIIRGRYDSRGVPPEAVRYARALMVSQPLTVGDSEISNVMLKFSYGAAITGHITFEGKQPSRTDLFRIAVESGEPGGIASATPAKDGTFTVGGIESGPRRVKAIGPPDWVLKGIYLNGRDIADVPIEMGEETVTSDLSVVFTSVKTPLTVTVEGARSGSIVTIFAFPEDVTLWHAESRRTVASLASDSPTVFSSLPGGDYLVAAVTDIGPNALTPYDPTFMERLRPLAQRVQLSEGKALVISVKAQALR